MIVNSGMKYDLATNFDTRLLDFIEQHDENHQLVSLFGKLRTDVVGGGRSSTTLPDITEKQLAEYNDRCKRMGIRFNYLLNPLCLGNKDVISSEHKEILRFLEKLDSLGIEWVTVNSPYLCEIIKRRFPNMKVTIGLYAVIQTVQQAKQWMDLGADELTLSHDVNRDFDNLRSYLKVFKGTNVNLRLIANNGCLHACPFSINHAAGVSHSSTCDGTTTHNYIDYNVMNCYYRKMRNPANLIASDWIRPEDVHYYKEICDEIGNQNLVIKLVERSKSTEFLSNLLDAFLHERYDGNLRELLNWMDEEQNGKKRIDASGYIKAIKAGELDLRSINNYMKFFSLPDIQIDNKKLDGFIQHFINDYHCKEKICWMENEIPKERDDRYCYYCAEWAKKAIQIPNEKEYTKWKKVADKLQDNMKSSRMFCVDKKYEESDKELKRGSI